MGRRLRLLTNLLGREAVRELLRYKVRSSLTTLGIMIGIASVVLVVAVGEAGSARAEAALQALGDNLVWVEAGSRSINGVRNGTHGTTSLTLDDAQAIAREVPLIKRMSPQVDGTILVIHGNQNWTTRYRGETPEYLDIKKWRIVSGAAFTNEDVAQSASKILIGRTVREKLFGNADPTGAMVRIQGQLFEVVGELAAKGQNPDGRDQDDWILLPHTTAQTKLRGRGLKWLDDVLCSAVSPEAVEPAVAQITSLMRQRHHIGPGDEDDFNIRRPDEVIKAQIEASHTLALLLLSIASVSLLVGGIGIMNVMLASVVQRTREIGVRLAIGAKESAIQAQFLGEAVTLSFFGGVLGIALSLGGAVGLERMLGWPLAISPQAVLLAVASSIAVGVCSGFYPASRAARMDPIAALRHE
jgi:putative ABC transport system permease protein